MAKINGFELKNIVNFRGHEGEDLIQGNVYYNDKKIGYYSQDAWGGMDIFDIDYNLPKELKEEIKNITDNYVGGVLFKKIDDLYDKYYGRKGTFSQLKQIGYEYLFMDLLTLKELEDIYKKYSKKWGVKQIYIVYKDLFNRQICGGVLPPQYKNEVYFNYKDIKDFVIE